MDNTSLTPIISASFDADVRWPLYTVLPGAALFFWSGYFLIWPVLAKRCAGKYYENMDAVGRMCFHANIGSCFHSYAVVLLLAIMIASDGKLSAPENRLHRYYNPLGYVTMCVTIGYFSLSVPWNLYLLCKLKRTDVVPKPMLIHHVSAQLMHIILHRMCSSSSVLPPTGDARFAPLHRCLSSLARSSMSSAASAPFTAPSPLLAWS